MATIVITSTDAGAPTLSGTNGTLCTVLDWALVQNSWAIEYTASNARIYRAASGNRNRLHVRHDSAITSSAALALWRGCEGATAASTFTDPFPTVAQVADASCCVLCSASASGTARAYRMILTPDFVILAIDWNGAGTWTISMFGDLAPAFSDDVYHTVCSADNNSSLNTTNRLIQATTSTTPITAGKLYFTRSIDGAVKSTQAAMASSGTALGVVASSPAARGGFMNRVLREKVGASCMGTASGAASNMSLPRRGWIPNFCSGLHNGVGTLTSGDTFADTAYHASALFRPLPGAGTGWAILEESDTWSAPSD